jgi:hypothetical protein
MYRILIIICFILSLVGFGIFFQEDALYVKDVKSFSGKLVDLEKLENEVRIILDNTKTKFFIKKIALSSFKSEEFQNLVLKNDSINIVYSLDDNEKLHSSNIRLYGLYKNEKNFVDTDKLKIAYYQKSKTGFYVGSVLFIIGIILSLRKYYKFL